MEGVERGRGKACVRMRGHARHSSASDRTRAKARESTKGPQKQRFRPRRAPSLRSLLGRCRPKTAHARAHATTQRHVDSAI
eukprot:2273202-Pleurochrysis_carterae.AAC.1